MVTMYLSPFHVYPRDIFYHQTFDRIVLIMQSRPSAKKWNCIRQLNSYLLGKYKKYGPICSVISVSVELQPSTGKVCMPSPS
jgi:hypothetical protein